MSVQIKSAEKLSEIIRRAFRVACSGTPGAVHLQIPEDMLLVAAPRLLHRQLAGLDLPLGEAAWRDTRLTGDRNAE